MSQLHTLHWRIPEKYVIYQFISLNLLAGINFKFYSTGMHNSYPRYIQMLGTNINLTI